MTTSYHRYQSGSWDAGTPVRLPTGIQAEDVNGIAISNNVISILVRSFTAGSGPVWTIYIQEGSTFIEKTQLPDILVQPKGLAVDSDGNYYVVEKYTSKFYVYYSEPNMWDLSGQKLPMGVSNPEGISLDLEGNIYVVDAATLAYYKFMMGVWGEPNSVIQGLSPGGIAIDINSNVWVQDIRTGRLYWNVQGESRWTEEPGEIDRFPGVKGITIDIASSAFNDGRAGDPAFTVSGNLDGNETFTASINGQSRREFYQAVDGQGNIFESILGAVIPGVSSLIPSAIPLSPLQSTQINPKRNLLGDLFGTALGGIDGFRRSGNILDTILDSTIGAIGSNFIKSIFSRRTTLPIVLFSTADGNFVLRKNPDGSETKIALPAAATDPKDVSESSNGDIFVLDNATRKIYRYSGGSWDSGIDFPVDELFPTGMAANGTVTFYGSSSQSVYSGGSWQILPGPIPTDPRFRGPQGFDIDGSNRYAVNGNPSPTVYIYRGTSWEQYWKPPGSATHVTGLAVQGNDAFVVDRDTRAIYRNVGSSKFLDLPPDVLFPSGLHVRRIGNTRNFMISVSDINTKGVWVYNTGTQADWRLEYEFEDQVVNVQGIGGSSSIPNLIVDAFTRTLRSRSGSSWSSVALPSISVDVCGLALAPDGGYLTIDVGRGYIYKYLNGSWSRIARLPSGVTNPSQIDVAENGDILVLDGEEAYRYTGNGWGLPEKLLLGIAGLAGLLGLFARSEDMRPKGLGFADITSLDATATFSPNVGSLMDPVGAPFSITFPISGIVSLTPSVLTAEELAALLDEAERRRAEQIVEEIMQAYFSVEFMFVEQPVNRLTSWPEDVEINGETFESAGSLVDVNLPPLDLDVVAREATVVLNQLTQQSISVLNAREFTGTRVNIYFSYIYRGVISDRLEFTGIWDYHTISPSDDGYTLTIKISTSLNTLKTYDPGRYTDAQHKLLYPQDRFFEFLNSQVGRRLN